MNFVLSWSSLLTTVLITLMPSSKPLSWTAAPIRASHTSATLLSVTSVEAAFYQWRTNCLRSKLVRRNRWITNRRRFWCSYYLDNICDRLWWSSGRPCCSLLCLVWFRVYLYGCVLLCYVFFLFSLSLLLLSLFLFLAFLPFHELESRVPFPTGETVCLNIFRQLHSQSFIEI